MKVNLMPKTKPGRWSLGLIMATPILFYTGDSLAHSLYQSVPAGKTILADIAARPFLALTMLTGMAAGVSAFITGLLAITRAKERALLAYIATSLGMLLTLFLMGEIVFPH